MTSCVPENAALVDETSRPSQLSSNTLHDGAPTSELLPEKCVEKRRARDNDGGILANLPCANKVSNTSICVADDPCNVDVVVDNQRTDENGVGSENNEEGYNKGRRTRNGGRRKSTEVESLHATIANALELKRKKLSGSLSEEYGLHLPVHSPCVPVKNIEKKFCNSNPNCLCSFRSIVEPTCTSLDKEVTISSHLVSNHLKLIGLDRQFVKMKGSKTSIRAPSGIQNLGATCYLNSQLQCLASFPPFFSFILNIDVSQMEPEIQTIFQEFQRIFANLKFGPSKHSISAESFARSLHLEENEMQDPIEFSRLLLDKLEECLPDKGEKLGDFFRGKCRFKTKCHSCQTYFESPEETFFDLLLPISTDNSSSQGKKENPSVQSSLDCHFHPEILEDNNLYHCEKCACPRVAERAVEMTKVPPILSIQLCRYIFSHGKKTKVRRKVKIDRVLSINTAGPEQKYHLVALQHHVGNVTNSGHYVADTMDWQTGCWFTHDDTVVKMMKNDNEDVSSSSVYNLFYASEGYIAANCMKVDALKFSLPVREINDYRASLCKEHERKSKAKDAIRSLFQKEVDKAEEVVWVPNSVIQSIINFEIPELPTKEDCEHGFLRSEHAKTKGTYLHSNLIAGLVRVVFDYLEKDKKDIESVISFSSVKNLFCKDCFTVKNLDKNHRYNHIEKLNNLMLDLTQPLRGNESKSFIVTKRFASSLKKYIKKVCKNIDSDFWNVREDDIDPLVNSIVTCNHGNLHAIPSQLSYVSTEAWGRVNALFPEAIAFKPSLNEIKCTMCQEALNAKNAKANLEVTQWKEWKKRFYKIIPNLLDLTSSVEFLEGRIFYIVSGTFLDSFRKCLNKKPTISDVNCLDIAQLNSSFKCCHQKTILPPDLYEAIAASSTFNSSSLKERNNIEIISELDYTALCKLLTELKQIIGGDLLQNDVSINRIDEIMVLGNEVKPSSCVNCMEKVKFEMMHWKYRPIYYVKLSPTDEIPCENSNLECEEVTSRRSKRQRTKKINELIVSYDDNLATLRLKIHEQYGEKIYDQHLYFSEKDLTELESNLNTSIKSLGIEPFSTLYLRYSDTKYTREERQILEESTISYLWGFIDNGIESRKRKEGFGGTFLGGSGCDAPSMAGKALVEESTRLGHSEDIVDLTV